MCTVRNQKIISFNMFTTKK